MIENLEYHATNLTLNGNTYIRVDCRRCRGCGRRMLLWRWRWAHKRCAATMQRWGVLATPATTHGEWFRFEGALAEHIAKIRRTA